MYWYINVLNEKCSDLRLEVVQEGRDVMIFGDWFQTVLSWLASLASSEEMSVSELDDVDGQASMTRVSQG